MGAMSGEVPRAGGIPKFGNPDVLRDSFDKFFDVNPIETSARRAARAAVAAESCAQVRADSFGWRARARARRLLSRLASLYETGGRG
jgi:hypothetical protein